MMNIARYSRIVLSFAALAAPLARASLAHAEKPLVYVVSFGDRPHGEAAQANRDLLFLEKDVALWSELDSGCATDVEARLYVNLPKSSGEITRKKLVELGYFPDKTPENVRIGFTLKELQDDLWARSPGRDVVFYVHGHGTTYDLVPAGDGRLTSSDPRIRSKTKDGDKVAYGGDAPHFLQTHFDADPAPEQFTRDFFLDPPIATPTAFSPWNQLGVVMCSCYGGSFFHASPKALTGYVASKTPTPSPADIKRARMQFNQAKWDYENILFEEEGIYGLLGSSRRSETDEWVCEKTVTEQVKALLRASSTGKDLGGVARDFRNQCSAAWSTIVKINPPPQSLVVSPREEIPESCTILPRSLREPTEGLDWALPLTNGALPQTSWPAQSTCKQTLSNVKVQLKSRGTKFDFHDIYKDVAGNGSIKPYPDIAP